MIEVTRLELDTHVLDGIAAKLGTNTDGVLQAAALEVEAGAKQRAPVDTGALRNSLHTRKIKRNEYRVEDGTNYGIFQELGTYKMAAHPFIIPAVEATRDRLVDLYKRLFA